MRYAAAFIAILAVGLTVLASEVLPRPADVAVAIPGHARVLISGPYTHRNLSIFIIHGEDEPDSDVDYIILEEGIKQGLVKITEAKREQVRELLVTNKSELPLYLQVGELVKGGKQDRTLQVSLVIPPKTTEAPIPSFCVEQSRWSSGKEFAAMGALAPSNATNIAIQSGSQQRVWSSVKSYKEAARANIGDRSSRTSSVNEELQNKDFVKIIEGYTSDLKTIPRQFARPLGMAYAVNGQISTVNVYKSRLLFKKLYPKLLKTAAAEAGAGQRVKEKELPSVTARDMAVFISSAVDGKKQERKLGYENVYVRIFGQRSLMAQLYHAGEVVHTQALATESELVVPVEGEPRPQRRLPSR